MTPNTWSETKESFCRVLALLATYWGSASKTPQDKRVDTHRLSDNLNYMRFVHSEAFTMFIVVYTITSVFANTVKTDFHQGFMPTAQGAMVF